MSRVNLNISLITLLYLSVCSGYPFNSIPDWEYPDFVQLEPPLYTDIVSWDFDNDYLPEIATCFYKYDPANPAGGRVILLELSNNRLNCFWCGDLIAGYQCLLWADVDGDRDMDLVAGTSVMIPNPDYTSVVYFENNGGTLSTEHSNLSSSTNWDVMDLQLGDFNFDDYPDILVLRAGNTPIVLEGKPALSLTGWTIEEPAEEVIPGVTYSGYRASVWDVNSDDHLDLACAKMYHLFELISVPGSEIFDETHIFKSNFWFSVAYTPPFGGSTSPSILSGNSWAPGVCIINYKNGETYENTALLAAVNNEYYVEFVSDLELVSVYDGLELIPLLAISEAGALSQSNVDDIRHRRGLVIEIESIWNGSFLNPVFGLEETESPRRPESFAVCWCDLNSRTTPLIETASFTGGRNLFHLNEALGDDFAAFRPVQKIDSAYQIDPAGCSEMIDVWYSGNGWFGCAEEIPSDNAVVISYLTSNEPDLFFARRGFIEGYSW